MSPAFNHPPTALLPSLKLRPAPRRLVRALAGLIGAALLCGPLAAAPKNPEPAPAGGAGGAAAAGAAAPKLSGVDQDKVKVDEKTEVVIKGALKWLASKQNANGSWSNDNGDRQECAMTGYVLMAYLSTGNIPDEGEHGKVVANAVNFLLSSVKADGQMQPVAHYMYGHGIATIALSEAYGQTRDARIRTRLESAVKLIIGSQNREGGWRYNPKPADADISVTVLQVVALRAAKNAGLEVPQETIDRAVKYVQSCYDDRSGGFCYQPHQQPGFARTAAAIYSLQVCGLYDDPRVKKGSDYLFKAKEDRQWYAYGHFYAAPAQYMIGGDTWERWYNMVKADLLKEVKTQGEISSWQDGGRQVGPVYVTAVYTMILAMPYHYMPLYQR